MTTAITASAGPPEHGGQRFECRVFRVVQVSQIPAQHRLDQSVGERDHHEGISGMNPSIAGSAAIKAEGRSRRKSGRPAGPGISDVMPAP